MRWVGFIHLCNHSYCFHHTCIYIKTSFTDESPVTSPNHRDSMASEDSYSSIISPVPGIGLWESDVTEIDLPKGKEGLGFSILDFAVSYVYVHVYMHVHVCTCMYIDGWMDGLLLYNEY